MIAAFMKLRSEPQATSAAIGFSLFLLALPASTVRAQGMSQCTVQPSATTVSFSQVNAARDAPVGSPLSEVQTIANVVRCPTNHGGGYYLQIFSDSQVSRTVPDVWETGTPGIGVRVISVDYGNYVMSGTPMGTSTDFGPTGAGSTGQYNDTLHFTFQLIKTGQITGTGQVSVANMYRLASHNIPRNVTSPTLASMALGNTTYASQSCRVTTPAVDVALPVVGTSTLRTAGATAATNTRFSIGLQCDVGSNVYVTLTDATTPGNRTDLLTLTRDSTANGVRIRIRNRVGTPVSFGPDSPAAGTTNQWLVGPSDSATSIPMTAEYVSTGDVEPGTANAAATFTMSYQ